jgi:TolB-like protein/DNA-binding winged helix-turn-helix (wHTH) protein/Tfp pilus assembly protein PilF
MNGKTVRVEPKVMQVLVCLAESQDVVAKDKLMRTVWADTFVTDDVLTRSISELRKVFDDDPRNPRYIQTIPKGGYRLLLPVEAVNGAKPASSKPSPAPTPESELRKQGRRILPILLTATLLLFLIAYMIVRNRSSGSVSTGRPMLAVLPFQNLSNDSEQDYFSDGLTAEMISQFGRLSSERLGVIAWSSAEKYKGTAKSPDQIGQELGANYLLEGTVRRSGNQVRITAELLQVGKRDHLWSNSYDGTLNDVLALQNRVAREIASEIRVQLTPKDELRLGKAPPVNGEGYDAYLKGKQEPDSASDKVAQLQQAIRLNPNYSAPYVAMAYSYLMLASRGFANPDESYTAARPIIAKALELDPDSSGGHNALAWIEWRHEWNFPAAEQEFRRAIDLDANGASTRDEYELFLKSMGRFDEALAQSRAAVKLSPRASYAHANLGSVFGLMKQYDASMREFQTAIQIDPHEPYIYERMGPVLLMQGKKDDAIDILEKARDYSGGQQDKLAWLGYAYAVSGRTDDAVKILEQLKSMEAQHQYVSPLHVALIYNGLGKSDDSLAWLEKAYRGRDEYLVYLKVYPEFQNLRSDSRFRELERKIGFKP